MTGLAHNQRAAANDSPADNPSAIARDALRQLAALRLPPTPENYARIYHELAVTGRPVHPYGPLAVLRDIADRLEQAGPDRAGAGTALNDAIDAGDWTCARELVLRQCVSRDSEAAHSWARLVRDLLQTWDDVTPGLTRARKRAMLEHVLNAFSASCDSLNLRLRGLLKSWSQSPPASARGLIVIEPGLSCATGVGDSAGRDRAQAIDDPVERDAVLASCRGLLAEALAQGVTPELGYAPALVQEARALVEEVRGADSRERVDALAVNLRAFWISANAAGQEKWAIQQGLLRLLQLVTANVSDVVGDGSWMHGQVHALAALARGKVTLAAIADLERGLLDMAERQGSLKHSLDEAKDAMKQMVATFIERLGALASNASEYHDRLAQYSIQIEKAGDIADLSNLVVEIMKDTRTVQVDLGRSREDLIAARRTVLELQERTARLEAELVTLSDRLQEDQLTRILNRRGLARVFAAEANRADRHQRPLCLAMVDLDNFKLINDSLGHQGGDAVLIHFSDIVRACLRASDIVARYGGEEFVILLPETVLEDAMAVMRRVQQRLAHQPFQHGEIRVAVTFSAGVAERVPRETQDELIARADHALYEAKTGGKNRLATR